MREREPGRSKRSNGSDVHPTLTQTETQFEEVVDTFILVETVSGQGRTLAQLKNLGWVLELEESRQVKKVEAARSHSTQVREGWSDERIEPWRKKGLGCRRSDKIFLENRFRKRFWLYPLTLLSIYVFDIPLLCFAACRYIYDTLLSVVLPQSYYHSHSDA